MISKGYPCSGCSPIRKEMACQARRGLRVLLVWVNNLKTECAGQLILGSLGCLVPSRRSSVQFFSGTRQVLEADVPPIASAMRFVCAKTLCASQTVLRKKVSHPVCFAPQFLLVCDLLFCPATRLTWQTCWKFSNIQPHLCLSQKKTYLEPAGFVRRWQVASITHASPGDIRNDNVRNIFLPHTASLHIGG